jgi:hypothetical protein
VQSELEWWLAYREAAEPELGKSVLAFIEDGLRFHENLAAVVHREEVIDPGFDHRKVSEWLEVSQATRRTIHADLATPR